MVSERPCRPLHPSSTPHQGKIISEGVRRAGFVVTSLDDEHDILTPLMPIVQADTSHPVTVRTRKFLINRLLGRRQFVVEVLHPDRPNVPKAELSEKLAALYKTDKARVVTFGLRTQFGGGRSVGFALIYDDEASQRKFEPKYRLIRVTSRRTFRSQRLLLTGLM
jgi:small subunit ribosomal protein S24e